MKNNLIINSIKNLSANYVLAKKNLFLPRIHSMSREQTCIILSKLQKLSHLYQVRNWFGFLQKDIANLVID